MVDFPGSSCMRNPTRLEGVSRPGADWVHENHAVAGGRDGSCESEPGSEKSVAVEPAHPINESSVKRTNTVAALFIIRQIHDQAKEEIRLEIIFFDFLMEPAVYAAGFSSAGASSR